MSHRFHRLIIPTLHREGWDKFTDDPDDPGGATRWGISLRTAEIHAELFDIDGDGDVDADDIEHLDRDTAEDYYLEYVWKPQGCDQIAADAVAAKVLDLSVNMGNTRGAKRIQMALRAVGRPTAIDGKIGPHTIGRINEAPTLAMMAAYRSEAAGYYRMITALREKKFSKYIDGWLNRAYA